MPGQKLVRHFFDHMRRSLQLLVLPLLMAMGLNSNGQTDSLTHFGPRLVFLSDLWGIGGKVGGMNSETYNNQGPLPLSGAGSPFIEWDMSYMTNASQDVSVVFKGGSGLYFVGYESPYPTGFFSSNYEGLSPFAGLQWTLGGQYRHDLGETVHLMLEAGLGWRYLLDLDRQVQISYNQVSTSTAFDGFTVKPQLYWGGGLGLVLPNLNVIQLLISYQYNLRDYDLASYVVNQGGSDETRGRIGLARGHWSVGLHYYLSEAKKWLDYSDAALEYNLRTYPEVERKLYMEERVARGKPPLRIRSGGFLGFSFNANGVVHHGPAFYTGFNLNPEVSGNTRWTYEYIWDDRFIAGLTVAGAGIQVNYNTDVHFREFGSSEELRGIMLMAQGGFKLNNGFRNLFDFEGGFGAMIVTNTDDFSGTSIESVLDQQGNIIGYVGEEAVVEKDFSPMAELGLSKNIWLGERLALEIGYRYVWMPTKLIRFTVTTQPTLSSPGLGSSWWGSYNHHNVSFGVKCRVHQVFGNKKGQLP